MPKWTKKRLQDEAYRRYQLQWMVDHGIHAKDLFLAVANRVVDCADPEDRDTSDLVDIDKDEAFRAWELNPGSAA